MPLTNADVNSLVSKLEGEREDLDRAIKLLKGLRGSPVLATEGPKASSAEPARKRRVRARHGKGRRFRKACQRQGCTTLFLATRASARFCRPCRRAMGIERQREKRDAEKSKSLPPSVSRARPKPAVLVPGDNLSRKGA